jgi:hypothetical protein
MDFTDIASGAQLASWILTGNLAALGQAGAIKAISAYYKYLNSVDTNVRKMFEVAEKLQRVKKDGLVPPRAGLSIYDVTKYGQKNLPQTNKPTQISTQATKTTPAKTGATAQSTKKTSISNKLGITKSNTEAIDRQVAIDFIDSLRIGKVGGKKVTEIEKLQFEIEARRLAPKYGINPELPPSKLATEFENKALATKPCDNCKNIEPSIPITVNVKIPIVTKPI